MSYTLVSMLMWTNTHRETPETITLAFTCDLSQISLCTEGLNFAKAKTRLFAVQIFTAEAHQKAKKILLDRAQLSNILQRKTEF